MATPVGIETFQEAPDLLTFQGTLSNEYLVGGGAGGVKPTPVFVFPSNPQRFNKA